MTDCTCVLRPGADVSVFSAPDKSEESSEDLPIGWFDARITSIERTPHESECNCKFYIKFYYINNLEGIHRKQLSKEVKTVGIDQVSVFQVLQQKPSENTHYRWPLSEDCTILSRTKLFLSKFASDITWLIVTSVQKQTVFDVRSVEKKIVYQILDTNSYSNSIHLSSVNFRTDGGIIFSDVFTFVPGDNKVLPVAEVEEEEDPLASYELSELRRSKRRYVQPERYLGEIGLEAADTTALRIGYKFWNQEDLALVPVNDDNTSPSILEDPPEQNFDQAIELYPGENFPFSSIGAEAKDEKLIIKDGDIEIEKGPKRKYVKRMRVKMGKNCKKSDDSKGKNKHNQLAIVPLKDEKYRMPREQSHLLNEIRPKPLDIDDDNVPLKFYTRRYRQHSTTTTTSTPRTRILELEHYDSELIFGGSKLSYRQYQKKKRRHAFSCSTSRSEKSSEDPSRKKKTLDLIAYKDLISTYMKNIQLTIENKEPMSTDAWKNLQGASSMYEKKASEEDAPPPEEEEEESETEMLFREMELCLASAYYEEEVMTV